IAAVNEVRTRSIGSDDKEVLVTAQLAAGDEACVDRRALAQVAEQTRQLEQSIVVKSVRRLARNDEGDVRHAVEHKAGLFGEVPAEGAVRVDVDGHHAMSFRVDRIREWLDCEFVYRSVARLVEGELEMNGLRRRGKAEQLREEQGGECETQFHFGLDLRIASRSDLTLSRSVRLPGLVDVHSRMAAS